MREFKGLGKVFSFTFTQKWRTRGYRVATFLLAVLLFVLPAGIMPAVEAFGGTDTETLTTGNVKTVFVADQSDGEVDYNLLNTLGVEGFTEIDYVACADFNDAAAQAAAAANSLILAVEQSGTGFSVHVLLPEDSALTEDDAWGLQNFLSGQFSFILVQKSGLDYGQLAEAFAPVETTVTTSAIEEEADPMAGVKSVLSFLLPYLNIMVLYFLVLFYGQSVANSVIMEKTSKLMDTFLVSVQPSAMIFGKVLAIVLSSAMQFLLWIAALAGGFAAGTALVKLVNPDTDMLLVRFFEGIGAWSGAFSISGAVVAVLLILSGFLLYCAVSAIGGAAAGKPEDLSSTNVLFTLLLVISFFCTLSSGAMTGTMGSTLSWLDLVPFTAILVTPSRVLLGDISVLAGLGSLALVLLVTAVFLFLAGKVYKMMALYKGNPPTPAKLLAMLRGK